MQPFHRIDDDPVWQQHDLEAGMAFLERTRQEKWPEFLGSTEPLPRPRWNGQTLEGKKILLRGEGGFGDEIIHVRFAERFARDGAIVIVTCRPSLVPLFDRMSGVAKAISHDEVKNIGPYTIPGVGFHSLQKDTPYDYWVPMMTAAGSLHLDYKHLPRASYIYPSPTLKKAWQEVMGTTKMRVGIRFSGSAKTPGDEWRRFPPEMLVEFHTIPGVKFYSLQTEDKVPLPGSIVDLTERLKTWDDTVAFIANLDLVITSDTAIAHLAGAMGKKTWVIDRNRPYWVWAECDANNRSWWYPDVTLLKRTASGDWSPAFDQIRSRLTNLATVLA